MLLTPAREARHVHFSPEPQAVGVALHQDLRQHHGHQIPSDSDDPFTGPGGNARMFSRTQVFFNFNFNFNFN